MTRGHILQPVAIGFVLSAMAAMGCGSGSPAASSSGGAGAHGGGGGGAGGAGEDPAALLPACPAEGVEPAPEDIFSGVYSVPVSQELEQYAWYPVDDIEMCRKGSAIHLGYTLPALLVGKADHVSFEGGYVAASGSFSLQGSEGSASCVRAAQWTCTETFTDMPVDLDAVATETEGMNPAEAEARLEVATQFSTDPIGVLVFTAP